jgi:hypothetical protein
VMLTHPPWESYYCWEYSVEYFYEDDALLLINKNLEWWYQGHGNYTGTLVHALPIIWQLTNEQQWSGISTSYW